MQKTILHFPEIRLRQRDGHKLRGYFAQQFGEESDLFHNHEADGKSIYRYPRIQFKVISGSPMVVGFAEGAQLLVERFLRIKELNIDGHIYPLQHKNLRSEKLEDIGVKDDLLEYRFVSPWMALNQDNYKIWLEMEESARTAKLKKILIGNMLNFFTTVGYREEKNILVSLNLEAISTSFKNQKMTAFKGVFTTNVLLPDYAGLGKSAARGYGTVLRIKS